MITQRIFNTCLLTYLLISCLPIYILPVYLLIYLLPIYFFTYLFTFNGHTPFCPCYGTLYEREWQKPRGRSIIYVLSHTVFRYILRRMTLKIKVKESLKMADNGVDRHSICNFY